MTLLAASRFRDGAIIISDSPLTWISRDRYLLQDSLQKTLLIGPRIIIGYVGDDRVGALIVQKLPRRIQVRCNPLILLGSPNGNRTRVFPPAQAEYPGPKKEVDPDSGNLLLQSGSPNGNRTRVSGVRGRYPRPLDDGT